MKAPTFIDRVTVHVRAGNGGNGVATFRREKFIPYGGPDGGDGGRGGSVYLQASRDASSLLPLYYQPHQRADHGGNGMSKQRYGRHGDDVVVRVPCGTEARDANSGEWMGEVLADGDRLLVARGGQGGLGNMHFKTSTHQAPRECTPGGKGDDRHLLLELKLISDAGLVGFPNAGKSTIIGRISNAHPKVAPYPFTTLHPVIGTVAFDDYTTLRVADIPGLVAGAHEGVGLGDEFLRHIERTRLLVLVIDMAGFDGRHPADDYFALRKELELYNLDFAERPSLVVANKMDLPEAGDYLKEFVRRTGVAPIALSADTGEGIGRLLDALRQWARESPPPAPAAPPTGAEAPRPGAGAEPKAETEAEPKKPVRARRPTRARLRVRDREADGASDG